MEEKEEIKVGALIEWYEIGTTYQITSVEDENHFTMKSGDGREVYMVNRHGCWMRGQKPVTKKENFYKTFDEKILSKIISGYYQEIVGGDECAYEDNGKDGCNYFESPDEIAPLILRRILSEGGDVWAEYDDEIWALEAKHLRFMGKKRIEEIVNHRVEWMFKKFPPEY